MRTETPKEGTYLNQNPPGMLQEFVINTVCCGYVVAEKLYQRYQPKSLSQLIEVEDMKVARIIEELDSWGLTGMKGKLAVSTGAALGWMLSRKLGKGSKQVAMMAGAIVGVLYSDSKKIAIENRAYRELPALQKVSLWGWKLAMGLDYMDKLSKGRKNTRSQNGH